MVLLLNLLLLLLLLLVELLLLHHPLLRCMLLRLVERACYLLITLKLHL